MNRAGPEPRLSTAAPGLPNAGSPGGTPGPRPAGTPGSAPGPHVLLACEAMATRFELVLPGTDSARLRAAGEEALRVIERLDRQLSCHRGSSDVSRINALADRAPVPVEPLLFALLRRARELHQLTAGTFDITIGPALRCWGLHERTGGAVPDERALALARLRVGMDQVELDERRRTIRFDRPGMAIDLGAIGKGYALEQAALALRELGITSALLHGGTSSITTIGSPPDAAAWQVAIDYPATLPSPATDALRHDRQDEPLLALVPLRDSSLSVSAVWGKSFLAGDACYGHVLDPRTSRPVDGALLAAVACDDGTTAEALSTALLVLGPGHHHAVSESHPGVAAVVVGRDDRTWSRGIAVWPRAPERGTANVA